MKLMKKLAALILVAALVMALGITASAEDTTVSIEVENAITGATYYGYRLLDTTTSLKNDKCHDDTKDHLSTCYNIAYSVNDKYANVLKAAAEYAATEEAIIEYIKKQESAEQIRKFANDVYRAIIDGSIVYDKSVTASSATVTFSDIESGYWLIAEQITAEDYEGAYSLVMLDTIGSRNITISTKRDEPALEKFVRDNGMNYGQGADLGIGDDAEFLLRTDVPNPIGYAMYKYVIHDKMSDALTLNASSFEIRVNGVAGELLDKTYYTVDTAPTCASGCKFHISVKIPEATAAGEIQGDSRLYISYTAKLNEKAEVMNNGMDPEHHANPNEAWLEYSNNPYNQSMTAASAPKKVYVWTFPLEVKKVDEANVSLDGAKFVVSRSNDLTESDLKDFNPVPDGKPDGYEKMIRLIDKGNNTYMVAPDGYTGAVVYEFSAGAAILQGFDDQVDYYLYETVAPNGYNQLNVPVSFKFFASYVSSESPLMAAGYPKVSIDAGVETSSMSASIVNKTGAELPSTGGIGTTIFYVLGSVMVLGAVVLLITKKRMSAEV